MSQRVIIEILKKCKSKWVTSKDIANMSDINHNTIVRNLKNLRKFRTIDFKQKNIENRTKFLYRYKEIINA